MPLKKLDGENCFNIGGNFEISNYGGHFFFYKFWHLLEKHSRSRFILYIMYKRN
ncbi:unnamed protein product [Ixodes pacificus]